MKSFEIKNEHAGGSSQWAVKEGSGKRNGKVEWRVARGPAEEVERVSPASKGSVPRIVAFLVVFNQRHQSLPVDISGKSRGVGFHGEVEGRGTRDDRKGQSRVLSPF